MRSSGRVICWGEVKIAELGMVEQSRLHSRTSQYGSMSRGMRFRLPELRATMREGLDEIRGGEFAREWAAEQEQGCPTLEVLRESARFLPLYRLERELRQALGDVSSPRLARPRRTGAQPPLPARGDETGAIGRAAAAVGRLIVRLGRRRKSEAQAPTGRPTGVQMEDVLRAFIAHAARDPALRAFANGQQVTTHYALTDRGLEFCMRFEGGVVVSDLGSPPALAEVRPEMEADVSDGMFTGRINPS
jgi:hypothetical protein